LGGRGPNGTRFHLQGGGGARFLKKRRRGVPRILTKLSPQLGNPEESFKDKERAQGSAFKGERGRSWTKMVYKGMEGGLLSFGRGKDSKKEEAWRRSKREDDENGTTERLYYEVEKRTLIVRLKRKVDRRGEGRSVHQGKDLQKKRNLGIR